MTFRHRFNFAGIDVHDAGIHIHDGFAFAVADAADAESAPAAATAANFGVLVLAAELRDAAHDNGVHTEQLADLGGAVRIRSIAGRKILLRQDLVQRFALNHRVGAILDQTFHQ